MLSTSERFPRRLIAARRVPSIRAGPQASTLEFTAAGEPA
jgi:hypothetical protein